MRTQYRLVHYLSDPFSDTRFPIAALVRDGNIVTVAEASPLSSVIYGGGKAHSQVITHVLKMLKRASTMDSLPPEIGPQAVLGPVRSIPNTVHNPAAWVRQYILPRDDRGKPRSSVSRQNRGNEGFRYFKQTELDRYVHRTFKPTRAWENLPSVSALPTISHWSGSPDAGLLLMEPIRTTSVTQDIGAVYSRMAGLDAFLRRAAPPEIREKTNLIVYILPGGGDTLGAHVAEAFKPVDVKIIDLLSEHDRTKFSETVRSVAASSKPPVGFGPTAN
jgi:hypothetical protein